MEGIIAILGLPADADDSAVLAEITKLLGRAKSAEEAGRKLKDSIRGLEEVNAELSAVAVERDMAKYADRIKPEAKETVREQLLKNRSAAIAILEASHPWRTAQKPMHNRNTAIRMTSVTDNLGAEEVSLARQAEEKINEYRIANRCSYESARNAVRRQSPELFGAGRS